VEFEHYRSNVIITVHFVIDRRSLPAVVII